MIPHSEGKRLSAEVPGVGTVRAEIGKGSKIVWLTHQNHERVLNEWEGEQATREFTFQYPSLAGLKFRW